jgi:LysR family transcriptional regulator (chromosome initiation inhibitor)
VQAVLIAPAILFNRKDSLHDDFLKRRFGFAVDRYPRHYLPSPMILMEGVATGVGYGLVPSLQAAGAAERGELVDLAPDEPVLVNLHWHHWELEPPLSREITDLVVRHAQVQLLPRAEQLPSETAASTPKPVDAD